MHCGALEDGVDALRVHDNICYGCAPAPDHRESESCSGSYGRNSDCSGNESSAQQLDHSTDNSNEEHSSPEETVVAIGSIDLRGGAADGASHGNFHVTLGVQTIR